jgi:hypothetical protein
VAIQDELRLCLTHSINSESDEPARPRDPPLLRLHKLFFCADKIMPSLSDRTGLKVAVLGSGGRGKQRNAAGLM